MEQPAESVECPICNKIFPTAKIQSHASSCLFLSESNEPQQRTKRFLSQESSPSTKKQKLSIENHANNTNKTPASPQQQSVSNTQEQPNTSKNVLFITFLFNEL